MRVSLGRVIDEVTINPRDAARALAHGDCEEQADFLLSFSLEVDRMNWAQQSNFIATHLKGNYSFEGCQQKVVYMLETLLEHMRDNDAPEVQACFMARGQE